MIFIISLAIALIFLSVYDTAIDTIFLCFLVDEEANKNSGLMLADQNLKEIVQKYEKESKDLADSYKYRSNPPPGVGGNGAGPAENGADNGVKV